MIDKLKSVIKRYNELAQLMSHPDAMNNMAEFTKMAKEHNNMSLLVENAKKYIKLHNQLLDLFSPCKNQHRNQALTDALD